MSGVCQCWHVYGPSAATTGGIKGDVSFPSSEVILVVTGVPPPNHYLHVLFQAAWVDPSSGGCCYFLSLVGGAVSTRADVDSYSSLMLTLCRSRFIELGKAEKSEEDQCCPMKLKTGRVIG